MMRTLYIVIIRIFNRIKNVYRKRHSTFIWKISDTAEWVYISYLTDIFYYPNDNRLLSSHQNRREALIIAKVFNQLGFNIYIQDHASKRNTENKVLHYFWFGAQFLQCLYSESSIY